MDSAEAVKWYRKAAEQGYGQAQVNLASMYYEGQGVAKDLMEAYAWFNLAASKGDEVARKNLGFLEKQMSAASILEGKKRAKELMKEIGKK